MAALDNITNKAQFATVKAREIDFVTRFTDNWTALTEILGIMNPIRKTPGTQLVTYTAEVDGGLQGGTDVAEGDTIPFTKTKVTEVERADIEIGKYAKSVTVEAVAKYGAEIAIQKTDDAFLTELQNKVLGDFYSFINGGTLKGTQKTWQRALAIAKGAVLDKFASINKTVSEVVGFANILDLYNYLGDTPITVQSTFGIQYVKDFMGYKTLFLLPTKYIAEKTVIALPVENLDLYYVDPSDSDFAKMGLQYTAQGDTNLIGFHVEGDYSRATGNAYALMGLKLWAEYIDGIAVVTVGSSNTTPAVVAASEG